MTIKQALREPGRLAYVKSRLASPRTRSRTRLAASLCRQFRFEDARGELRVSSCAKALRELEDEGLLELPPRQQDVASWWRPRRLANPVPAPEGVPPTAGEVQGLRLVLVRPEDDPSMRRWAELIAREHPQGDRRLVGRQLRYLVGSAHGWLGAIGFSASALRLEARDRWIGWDPEQRIRHQGRVLGLSRFLIRPSVRCQNLASRVLGTCLRRVARDFEDRYGYPPWLLESFVDSEQHLGTCFQAANWQRIGSTKGRGRNDREERSPESVKEIYVYPLVEDFRTRMGVPADRGRYLRPRPVEQAWGRANGPSRSSARWNWETSGCEIA